MATFERCNWHLSIVFHILLVVPQAPPKTIENDNQGGNSSKATAEEQDKTPFLACQSTTPFLSSIV
jgi:hypothetical protein